MRAQIARLWHAIQDAFVTARQSGFADTCMVLVCITGVALYALALGIGAVLFVTAIIAGPILAVVFGVLYGLQLFGVI